MSQGVVSENLCGLIIIMCIYLIVFHSSYTKLTAWDYTPILRHRVLVLNSMNCAYACGIFIMGGCGLLLGGVLGQVGTCRCVHNHYNIQHSMNLISHTLHIHCSRHIQDATTCYCEDINILKKDTLLGGN